MASNYKPGDRIARIEDLVRLGEAGQVFFWGSRPRPLNWAFLKGLQLWVVLGAIKSGALRVAVRKPRGQ